MYCARFLYVLRNIVYRANTIDRAQHNSQSIGPVDIIVARTLSIKLFVCVCVCVER